VDINKLYEVTGKCEGGGKNTKLNLLEQVFNESSLVLNNVIVREVRIAILFLPPKETLLDREK